MDGQRRFAVIGTDARLAAAGRALARAGFAVGGPEQTALADYILLPLPLDESRTPLAELLRAARPGALALGGKLSAQARQIAAEAGVELVDYFAREELILSAGGGPSPFLNSLPQGVAQEQAGRRQERRLEQLSLF